MNHATASSGALQNNEARDRTLQRIAEQTRCTTEAYGAWQDNEARYCIKRYVANQRNARALHEA
jgi:hypothetical protein